MQKLAKDYFDLVLEGETLTRELVEESLWDFVSFIAEGVESVEISTVSDNTTVLSDVTVILNVVEDGKKLMVNINK